MLAPSLLLLLPPLATLVPVLQLDMDILHSSRSRWATSNQLTETLTPRNLRQHTVSQPMLLPQEHTKLQMPATLLLVVLSPCCKVLWLESLSSSLRWVSDNQLNQQQHSSLPSLCSA